MEPAHKNPQPEKQRKTLIRHFARLLQAYYSLLREGGVPPKIQQIVDGAANNDKSGRP
jgi:hypothetical protein